MKTTVSRLSVVVGVVVLAIVLSLKLEGAPQVPREVGAGDKLSSGVSRETTMTNVNTLSAIQTSPYVSASVSAGDPSRVKVGTIPTTGLQVIATIEVDWRDDEGTRLRQAGKLIGPMPSPDEMGVVATGGACNIVSCLGKCPGQCSHAVQCDDANPCTTDTCDFIVGSAPCSGSCVHDPVKNGEAGRCDDGVFCNGKITCEGSKCTADSVRHANLPCDAHFECRTPGTCEPVLLICLTGNIGADCTVDDDCAVPGTGSCLGGVCTPGPIPQCCHVDDNQQYCSELLAKCSAESSLAGTICTIDSNCPDGECEHCQPACKVNADCTDGRRCNGIETCAFTCVGGPNNGDVCTTNTNCGSVQAGACVLVGQTKTCQLGDVGAACTTDVDCIVFKCLGQCQPGFNPCGAGARCSDRRCGTVPNFEECEDDSDCPEGETCNNRPAPGYLCFLGRCCDPAASDATSCTKKCLINDGSILCNSPCPAGSLWYAMEGGQQLEDTGTVFYPCGGTNPADLTHDPFGCPKYTSGFTQLKAGQCVGGSNNGLPCNSTADCPGGLCGPTPIYPVTVGPISDSQVCAPAPGGPGGVCANPFGTGRLYQLGDDYKVPNSSYLQLEVVRFVLNVINTSRLSLDVYDKLGYFVEDVNVNFQTNLPAGLGIVVVIFRAPLTIPPEGYIVLRTSERFLPNSKAFWLSTTTTAGIVGSNFDNVLWVNSYPGVPSVVQASNGGLGNNFLKMCDGGPRANEACVGRCVGGADAGEACLSGTTCLSTVCDLHAECPDAPTCAGGDCKCGTAPGILAFELVGDKVPDPTGACCEAGGACVDGVVSWVCFAQGNSYLGDGRRCAACNGGTNTGGACRTCSNALTTSCTGAVGECPGGSCQPNTSKCRTCLGGTAPPGTPCTTAAHCRTCQGGTVPPGTPCTSAGVCGVGGTCPVSTGTCPALAKACSTGLVGNACTTSPECDLAGHCSLSAGFCVGGINPGVECTTAADCRICSTGTCTGNRVCSTKQCSVSLALCTGTGLGDCNQSGANAGQTCDFITCTSDTPCTPTGGTCPAAVSVCTGTGQGTCPPNQTCSHITCTSDTPCLANGGTCPAGGVCTFANTCDSGAVGQACTLDSHCNVAGTCVPVACQSAAVCSKGACCNADPLVCNATNPQACCTLEVDEATCEGVSGRTWQGFGTECDADSGYDEAQQHCCRIPQYSDKRCMGGPFNNNPSGCTVDTECRFCVGGTHHGAACTTTTPTCIDLGTCNLTTDLCEGGTRAGLACTTDADCPDNSGICRGRCVNRGSGGDNCTDAYVHVITVPDLSEGPKTITLSGTNIYATNSDDEPENCSFNGTDPMWWEAFKIDKCARVRLDFCCSDPTREPQWDSIIGECNADGSCANFIASTPDPYTAAQSASARGKPYCDGDDVWGTYGPLDPGTYWQPVYSDLAGAHGDYQIHITVQACPKSACCYSVCGSVCLGGNNAGALCNNDLNCGACDGSSPSPGSPCDADNDCTPGTCIGRCSGNGGANFGLHCDKNVTCPGGACTLRPKKCSISGVVCTGTGTGPCNQSGANAGQTCNFKPCTEHFDCGPLIDPLSICTVTCVSQCTELDESECDAKLGYLLAPPNVATAQSVCFPTTCGAGSCCTGPGECLDQVSDLPGMADDDTPMTSAVCDEFGGFFVGGVRCRGGHCVGGADAGESCSVEPVGQCAAPGVCTGTTTELALPEPCPICQFKTDSNCQHEPGGFIYDSDSSGRITPTSSRTATKVADDVLITETGMVETMCVIGTYLHFQPPQQAGAAAPPRHYCGEGHEMSTPVDNFTVSVYKTRDGSSIPATNSMPGELLGTSGTTIEAKGLELTFNGTERYFRYQLKLTDPIGPLMQGKVYWIEFSNDTSGGEQGCNWWTLTANDDTGQGNGFFMRNNGKIFTQNDANPIDIPFCLNLPFDPPPTPTRACCTCNPAAPCIDATLEDCIGALVTGVGFVPGPGVEWVLDALTCATNPNACPAAPPNDLCANALTVSDGKHNFRNFCAGTDGPTPVQCRVNRPPVAAVDAASRFERDVWFNYTATCNGQLRVSTCDRDRNFDSVLAIYHNAASPTLCPCPTDASLQVGLCSDDDTEVCEYFGGPSELKVAVFAGRCYTIRVGGFAGSQDEGRLTIECYAPPALAPECGNNIVESGEQCDGTSSANCPGQCRAPTDYNGCTCKAVCGRECIGGTKAGLACNSIADCPGGTGCTNIIEYGEECDGNNCGNQNCRPPGDPRGGCTCPPVCGNGRKEGSELCDPDTDHLGADPDDDLCLGLCRGDCTCPRVCGNECIGGTNGGLACTTFNQTQCPGGTACTNVKEVGEACDGAFPTIGHPCPGRCGASPSGTTGTCDIGGTKRCTAGQVGLSCAEDADCDVGACACPAPFCGNNKVETLTNDEECDGTATEADGSACPPAECRSPNDPLGECTCACAGVVPPNIPVWAPATSGPTGPTCSGASGAWPNCNPQATTRSLRFTVTGDPGPSKPEAIKVTMIDLQNPIPPNQPGNSPPNFGAFESATCTGDPVCTTPLTCTLPSNSCARWVGKLGTFLEYQGDGVAGGTFRAARLQCTPYYWDWKPEGLITVVGAEIAPSSQYSVVVYGVSCTGAEAGCLAVSSAVTMYTRRSGDAGPNFNPPATTDQPDALDIAAVVNKLKSVPGSLAEEITQMRPNLVELNADINALDIAAVVDGVKFAKYGFSGPCPCPSTVTCGLTSCTSDSTCAGIYGAESTCVKTCVGGANAGDPCINDTHCPPIGVGTCGAGFCRDRCGRCN